MTSKPTPKSKPVQVRGYHHMYQTLEVEQSAPTQLVYNSSSTQQPIPEWRPGGWRAPGAEIAGQNGYPAAPPFPLQQYATPENDILVRNTRRAELYNLLAALDPYKATPKEFIHLLVAGALDNEAISRAIYKMHDDKVRTPHTWQPILGPAFHGAPTQFLPPNTNGANPHGQPPRAHPRERLILPAGTMDWQNAAHSSTSQGSNHGPALPPGSLQPPPGPIPPPSQISAPGSMPHPNPGLQPDPKPPGPTPQDQASAPNGYPKELDDGEPPEPKEQSCNYTWVVDRTETLLGWTGNWDRHSKVRQRTIGKQSANKILKLLQMMTRYMEKHKSFANRVHCLCVMREVLMATLETDSIVGETARANSQGFDDAYVLGVEQLTDAHRRKLCKLEDGKVIQELRDLVTEAKHQFLFPRLEHVLETLENPPSKDEGGEKEGEAETDGQNAQASSSDSTDNQAAGD